MPLSVRELIHAFGGPAVVGDRLGGIRADTVSMWGTRDSIPPEFHIPVWRLAQEAGIDWKPPGAEGLAIVPDQAA